MYYIHNNITRNPTFRNINCFWRSRLVWFPLILCHTPRLTQPSATLAMVVTCLDQPSVPEQDTALLWGFSSQSTFDPLSGGTMFSVLYHSERRGDIALYAWPVQHYYSITHLSGDKQAPFFDNPVNTKHLYSIYAMSDQRRRRWADVV